MEDLATMNRKGPSSAASKLNKSARERSNKLTDRLALRPPPGPDSTFPRRGYGYIEFLAVGIPLLAIYLLWLFIDHCDDGGLHGQVVSKGYGQHCGRIYQCCHLLQTDRPLHFGTEQQGQSNFVSKRFLQTHVFAKELPLNIKDQPEVLAHETKIMEDKIARNEVRSNLKQRGAISRQLGQLYMTNNIKVKDKLPPNIKEILADIECLDASLNAMSQLLGGGFVGNKPYFEEVYQTFNELFLKLSEGSRCRRDTKQIKKRMMNVRDKMGLDPHATWTQYLGDGGLRFAAKFKWW